jgi:hypothetical protein
MKNDIYYHNLLQSRTAALYIVEREITKTRRFTTLRNGRSLNRLSTKQLVAKLKSIHKLQSKRTTKLVGFLNGYSNPIFTGPLTPAGVR